MGIGWNILGRQGKDSGNYNEMVATNRHPICPAPNFFLFISASRGFTMDCFKQTCTYKYDCLFWLLDSFSSRGGVGRYSTLPLSGVSLSIVLSIVFSRAVWHPLEYQTSS